LSKGVRPAPPDTPRRPVYRARASHADHHERYGRQFAWVDPVAAPNSG